MICPGVAEDHEKIYYIEVNHCQTQMIAGIVRLRISFRYSKFKILNKNQGLGRKNRKRASSPKQSIKFRDSQGIEEIFLVQIAAVILPRILEFQGWRGP